MEPKFKLISSADADTFEARLERFIASLEPGDLVIDVKFSTAAQASGAIFSALIHVQRAEDWRER